MTDFGRHTFGKDEIIAFARQFDPQPFHLDEAAGKGLAVRGPLARRAGTRRPSSSAADRPRAAGQRAARTQGVRVRRLRAVAGLPQSAVAEAGVRRRHDRVPRRLTEKIDLKSRPDRGLLVSEVQGRNQKGEIVFAITSQILAERRAPYGRRDT